MTAHLDAIRQKIALAVGYAFHAATQTDSVGAQRDIKAIAITLDDALDVIDDLLLLAPADAPAETLAKRVSQV